MRGHPELRQDRDSWDLLDWTNQLEHRIAEAEYGEEGGVDASDCFSQSGEMAAGVERAKDTIYDHGCVRSHTAGELGGRGSSRAEEKVKRVGLEAHVSSFFGTQNLGS